MEGVTPQEAEDLQQRMAHEFGADIAATDASRVLRLPGFVNRKYGNQGAVRVTKHSDKTYNLRDFKVASGPAKGDRTPEQRPPRLGGPRETLTQSERDWAYAKRALARGDDPEEIIRHIADYRADDKHDPEYYARYTVAKAQADLQSRAAEQSSEVAEISHNSRETPLSQTTLEVPDPKTATPQDEFPMTVREAAKFLGVSQQTVYLWVERKQIPHLRVMGRNIRFLKSELASFRASFKQEMENA